MEVLVKAIKQEKVKVSRLKKKLQYLEAGSINLWIENPKEFPCKIRANKGIHQACRVEINISTSNEQSGNRIKKTMSFIIV